MTIRISIEVARETESRARQSNPSNCGLSPIHSQAQDSVPLFLSGDSIRGRAVVSRDELDQWTFDLVEIALEGSLSTTIARDMHQIERCQKLLHLTDSHQFSNTDSSGSEEPNPRRKAFSFHFLVPDQVIFLADDVIRSFQQPDFHVLPPSLQIVSQADCAARLGDHVGFRKECNINYRLRARAISCGTGKCIAETSHPIKIFPSSKEAAPPICIGDFPTEYTMSASREMYKAPKTFFLPLKRRIGKLSLSTTEPAPLEFSRCKKWSTTTVQLRLAYQHPLIKNAIDMTSPQSPPTLCYGVVKSSLCATTFFSVWPLTSSLPTQQDIAVSPLLMAKNSWIHSHQVRRVQFSPWIKENSNSASDEENQTVWISESTIIMKYCHDDLPAPTFASTFVSRRYSLLMKVAVEGSAAKMANFSLKIPVQLYYQGGMEEGCNSEDGVHWLMNLMDQPPAYTP